MDSSVISVKLVSSFLDGFNLFTLITIVISLGTIIISFWSMRLAKSAADETKSAFRNEYAYRCKIEILDSLIKIIHINELFTIDYKQSRNEYVPEATTLSAEENRRLKNDLDNIYQLLKLNLPKYEIVFGKNKINHLKQAIKYKSHVFDKEDGKYYELFGPEGFDCIDTYIETQELLLNKAFQEAGGI